MYKLKNKDTNIKYYMNTNNSVLYIYNIKKNRIDYIYSNDFSANKLEVIFENDKKFEEKKEDIKSILRSENDFIQVVKVIASTTKEQGYFKEYDTNTNIETHYLNIYLNSILFIESKKNNKYKIDDNNNLFSIFEKECNTIYLLLKNLFYKESDLVLSNFLNWLSYAAFNDNRQDIIFLFKGKSEEEQGQGSGKGVLRELLDNMFNGLVCSVSNETYNDKFNSELLNKKIVIFDEVNFKTLKYDKLKDITGNSKLRVENKGKDAIVVDNVSSWLLFKNLPSLENKIKIDDRRTFIIEPNPKNGSLKNDIIDKLFSKDFNSFRNKLFSEIDNFIHILGLLPGKPKSPLEIQTQAHFEYFNVKKTLIDIGNIEDIFLNKNKKIIFIDFLKELELLGDISKSKYINIKYFLEHNFYYQNVFEVIFDICQSHKIAGIKNNDSERHIIKNIKDILLSKDYEFYTIETKFNDYYNKKTTLRKKNCIRESITDKMQQKNINNKLKSMVIANQEEQHNKELERF